MTYPLHLIGPNDVSTPEGGLYPFDLFAHRYLAQGDSWFSIGAIPPTATTNLLQPLQLAQAAVAVNCAIPGRALAHMTDRLGNPGFIKLLDQWTWDALLLSGGGNDLIDAAQVGPDQPAALRLLATAAERPADPAPDDCISAPGWATFAAHLGQVFGEFMALRATGPNQATPLVLHDYAFLTPRFAPAGPGFGPWLAPALQAFDVPAPLWKPVADALLARLGALLHALVAAHQDGTLQLVDSQTVALVQADPASTGASGDFANEIHPAASGYARLAAAWAPVLDALP
ncbi:MAG: hypothetical protein JO224_01980 [Pelomonas sp.]|nr:hypothetical protein [Roseateles sp.]